MRSSKAGTRLAFTGSDVLQVREGASLYMAVFLWGTLVVIASVLLAIVGQAIVQRLVPISVRQASNTANGAIYAALHVVFGVSLAFSLFLVSDAFREAQKTVESEAGNLKDIYQEAEQLPEPEGIRIRQLAESYARAVVDEEWPLMGEGRGSRPSPQAERLSDELEESIESFEPGTSREQTLHTKLIDLADDLGNDRELRLLDSRQGVPSLLWTALVVGGVLTVAFTFLFGIEPPWFHRLAIAALTVVVVLVLYTIYRIELPFTGDVRVSPEAFELVLGEMSDP